MYICIYIHTYKYTCIYHMYLFVHTHIHTHTPAISQVHTLECVLVRENAFSGSPSQRQA